MNCRGFTLIELMIALLLAGLVLVAATLALASLKSIWLQRQLLDERQEILRFAVEQLRRSIRQADQVLLEADTEVLKLSFVAGSGVRNCIGQVQADATLYQERFHVSEQQLRCNGQALISGIHAIRFLYGADLNQDGRIGAEEWYTTPPCCVPVQQVAFTLQFDDGAEEHFYGALRRWVAP